MKVKKTNVSRREFLRVSAITAAGLALGACSQTGAGGAATEAPAAGEAPAEATTEAVVEATGRTVKIGYVSPQTGPIAGFGEADDFILKGIREVFADGISIAGQTHPLEIVVKDSQSDPNRAAEVAADLILSDNIDLMVVSSTPETTNPVSDQCEVNGVPCISTVAPWQPWYFRNPDVPESGYEWAYHFFWGLEDIIAVFLQMWGTLDSNKVVGGMWPNDGDGLAWSSPEVGFPPALEAEGYTVVDPGRYENLKDDFSAEISAFKEAGVEIVTGVMIPPDLVTFMTQASQQGFTPKAVTVGKAALFPASVEAIGGGLGAGLSSEIWWTPSHPFNSSLTGASSADFANAYQTDTSKQWTQPIGFVHALFEIAADTLKRTENVDDKASILAALKATQLDTIVGSISWEGGPVPNVAKTPLVGGQWVEGQDFPFDLVITSNSLAPDIPAGGTIEPMVWG
jgi:branched-chain amino acid transport system substrate-binding protein